MEKEIEKYHIVDEKKATQVLFKVSEDTDKFHEFIISIAKAISEVEEIPEQLKFVISEVAKNVKQICDICDVFLFNKNIEIGGNLDVKS